MTEQDKVQQAVTSSTVASKKATLKTSALKATQPSLTLIADTNIANLHDYFCPEHLGGRPVTVIGVAGREITASLIATHQPDALLIRSVTPVNAELLADNQSVRFVGSATIGTDHVDTAYLTARNIAFANAAGCSKHSVAQYVMAAILSLRPNYWQPLTPADVMRQRHAQHHVQQETLHKPILGIIGLGNIGSTLAQYAEDLGWQILGYDPYQPQSALNNATLSEVLSQSNAISLHVPLTTAEDSSHPTYHMIDETALAQMPVDSMLINSARGQVVSETGLIADHTRTHRQVVLDVFEHEPTVSKALLNRLALATPHIAGYTVEGKLRGTHMIYEALCQQFGICASKRLDELLPENPYQWTELQANPSLLEQYYDIQADSKLLTQAVTTQTDTQVAQVAPANFDALRKNYLLRREWLYT